MDLYDPFELMHLDYKTISAALEFKLEFASKISHCRDDDKVWGFDTQSSLRWILLQTSKIMKTW